MMLPEPVAVTLQVTAVLEKLGIPYLVVGSLASTIYGMIRTTLDSDLVAELRPENVNSFVLALENEFYLDEEMIADSVEHHTSFNIIHRVSMFKVDIFIPQMVPFIKEQLSRACRQVLATEPRVEAMVATAEDTLLAKLDWYRMGGCVSERQWGDVLGILKIQAGRLDLDYLDKWAGELTLGDLLERALTQSAS
jgi:hypothetical protein